MINENEMLDFQDAARMLGVSHPTLYRWIRAHKVKAFKVGKQWRFHRSDLVDLLQESSSHTERAVGELRALAVALGRAGLPVQLPEPFPTPLSEAAEAATELLLVSAVRSGASDVHLDPRSDGGTRVRLRIHGKLLDVGALGGVASDRVREALEDRAGGEEAVQTGHGRLPLTVDDREIGLRATVLPTVRGPRWTLRVLDSARLTFDPAKVFPQPEDRALFDALCALPFGLVLISGAGGSGKTTTAYALLRWMADRDQAVFSLENPVEYLLDGVVQVEVASEGLAPEEALRRVMRSDPDVILLGEVHDAGTARAACKAALTGHLVIVQMQASSAAGAIASFVRAAGDPHLVASSLAAATCQRLVRRVCSACSEPGDDGAPRAVGCSECVAGYRGRAPVYELARPDNALLEAIGRGASEAVLAEQIAASSGSSMRQRATELVEQGVTTSDELDRVFPQ